jgi:cytochrome c oxidase assembly factor CtaG
MRSLTQNLALAGGLTALGLTLLPPLSGAAQQLLSFHMLQHLLLIVAAAPLLIASRALQSIERRPWFTAIAQPVTAWLGFVGVFVFWHWPAAFQWAAGAAWSRLLEQTSIFAVALLFWSVALAPEGRRSSSYGARALWVLTAAIATDLPGVIMVFSPRVFCAMPAESAWRWTLTPLQDQQIAGLLMWVPANLVFFGMAMSLFARWMSDQNPQEMVSR